MFLSLPLHALDIVVINFFFCLRSGINRIICVLYVCSAISRKYVGNMSYLHWFVVSVSMKFDFLHTNSVTLIENDDKKYRFFSNSLLSLTFYVYVFARYSMRVYRYENTVANEVEVSFSLYW